jgi:hypothetical protein
MALVTGAIGFPMGYALIMTFGVIGLIITMLTASLPSLVMALVYVRKTYGVTVDWLSSARILLSSAVAGVATYLAILPMHFSSWVELILGVLIFVVVLVPLILLTRAIDHNDLDNLREMTGGLGGIGKILTLVIDLLEKLMTIFKL